MKTMMIVISVVLILGGLGWMGLCVLAGNMADREVNWFKDICLPASLGLIPIAIAVLLLCK